MKRALNIKRLCTAISFSLAAVVQGEEKTLAKTVYR
jgi:hypothetical protein